MRSLRLMVVVAASMLAVLPAGCGMGDEPSSADVQFVAAMVPHHRLGLELIALAEPRAADVRLRRLVFEMTAYHHEELHALETRLDEWGTAASEDFPGAVAPEQLAALAVATGGAFDRAWLVAMIDHHQGAVDLAGDYQRTATDAVLRDLARRVEEVQRTELDAMRTLLRAVDQ